MQHVWEFWTSFFWISVVLLILSGGNILTLIILTELLWGIIYIIATLSGVSHNNLILISFCFFILVFAALEFVLGIFLITILKLTNINPFFYKNEGMKNKKDIIYNFKKANTNYLEF